MKTIITKTVETETQLIQFGWYDGATEEFIPIETAADFETAAETLECSVKLIEALVLSTTIISESIHTDLSAIWERMDEANI